MKSYVIRDPEFHDVVDLQVNIYHFFTFIQIY